MVTVELTDNLDGQPLVLPDAVIRLIAEWIVEGAGQDSRENPVDLPLVSGKVPSQADHTKVLDV